MTVTFQRFRADSGRTVADPHLQKVLENATGNFREGRVRMLADVPDADQLRDQLKAIRAATLARLADHLETFERNAAAAGAILHWAKDAADACRQVLEIARQHGVTLAVKSKSMASEEIHLNHALQEAGVTPVETDLGEWIIQLAGDPPAHIIVPAIHVTRHEVANLFSRELGRPIPGDDIPGLTAVARQTLRQKFLAAGMGLSGVNVAVAETGSVVLVTNEGNGRMVTGAPPVHVAIMGIEKIVPTWQDAAVWLSLLARSATGQPLSIYTTAITGPARPDDPDGPREVHIILLDNGRSRLLGTPYEEILQCIRCGACLNVCPVYREAGGHSYGSPYSGPIGAVLTPLIFGLEQYEALPHASSLCGACLDVCPARIDLPRMLLALRAEEVEKRILPWYERIPERAAAWGLGHARLYRLATGLLRVLSRPLVKGDATRWPRRLNPAGERNLPALARRSFREMWKDL